jgi:hypothetical protein
MTLHLRPGLNHGLYYHMGGLPALSAHESNRAPNAGWGRLGPVPPTSTQHPRGLAATVWRMDPGSSVNG